MSSWKDQTPCPIKVHSSWYPILETKLKTINFQGIRKIKGMAIYPPKDLVFTAFQLTPFDKIKVVILGQDPYHNPGQAHGLAFSVPDNIPIPPSLTNILKEAGISTPKSGNLTHWAQQGVFLLNSALTVLDHMPGSHLQYWEKFTDSIIQEISDKRENVVFILWGNYARNKAKLIDQGKHLILESAHPSPLSARNFFGNHHFIKANKYLESHGIEPIIF